MDESTIRFNASDIQSIIRRTIARYALAYTTNADADLVIVCKHNMEVILPEFDVWEYADDTFQATRMIQLKTPTAEFSFYETLEFTEYGWDRTIDLPAIYL